MFEKWLPEKIQVAIFLFRLTPDTKKTKLIL
jgi:hypothetical protein